MAGNKKKSLVPTPLHIALWNGNLEQITKCLEDGESIETRDLKGNRALHLAIKFAHRNSNAIVKCLLDHGARVRSRDFDGWKTVHHAVASNNEELLATLIQKEKEQAPGLLTQKINEICPRLAEVPDFYCELYVEISSWIPGISRWLPKDTVKIWKKHDDIRFDITLVGFENGAWKRGNLTFLLLGGKKQFMCLDHDDKVCTNLLKTSDKLEDKDVNEMLHFLMTTSLMTTNLDARAVVFERKSKWFSTEGAEEDIGRWANSKVFEMSGIEANLRIRRPQNKHRTPPESLSEKESQSYSAATEAIDALTGDAFHRKECVVTISAGCTHVVSAELKKDERVTWSFSTDGYDIGFGVDFLKGHDEHHRSQVVALDRVASHKEKQTGHFQAPTEGTLLFTWDNSYSNFRDKELSFYVGPEDFGIKDDVGSGYGEDGIIDSAGVTTQEMIAFRDWFEYDIDELPENLKAMDPRHSIMVHKQPPCRKLTKSFSATVYMSDAFPLTVQQFLPVIEVLSKTTSTFETVKDFFNATLVDGFPVQFRFPLVPSVSATFRFDEMKLLTPDDRFFVAPTDYKLQEEDVLSPRTHRDMLNMVASK